MLPHKEHSVSHYSFSKDYGEVTGVHEQERGEGKGEVMNERCHLKFLIRHKDFRKYISVKKLLKISFLSGRQFFLYMNQ